MKFAKFSITLFIGLSQIAFAGEVSKQTETIAAQIRVTHNSLQQVLAKMRNTPTESSQFTHPDFVFAAKLFNARAERAMIHFEDSLKTIINHIDFYEKRIEAIRKSSNYSVSQRDEIIRNQLSVLKVEFEKYSRDYQDALIKLITLDLPQVEFYAEITQTECRANYEQWKFIVDFPIANVKLKAKHTHSILTRFCVPEKTNYVFPIDTYLTNTNILGTTVSDGIRSTVVNHSLLRPCLTSGCASLMSELRKNYVALINSALFTDMSFSSYSLDSNPGIPSGNYGRDGAEKTLFPETLRAHFSLEPEDTRGLPFDVSEGDFVKIQNQRINSDKSGRTNAIEDIQDYLLSKSLWNFGDWECRTKDIQRKHAWLCEKTFIGCLNPDEADTIVQAIKTEYPNLKEYERRIKCLNDNTN